MNLRQNNNFFPNLLKRFTYIIYFSSFFPISLSWFFISFNLIGKHSYNVFKHELV